LEVTKAVGLAIDELYFVVEAFGDADGPTEITDLRISGGGIQISPRQNYNDL
jgi:hypothetical protein